MDRVKRIWYLSPMRAAKVQASLRIRAVSPEPLLLAHISSESRGTFRQKARSLAPPNGWACAVKMCHDGMLEDTNSLDGAHIIIMSMCCKMFLFWNMREIIGSNHYSWRASKFCGLIIGAMSWENMSYAICEENKGVDKPAHSHSLISAFVVHCLDNIIHILAKSKILRL